MYSPYILRYRYCRHVTLDVFWLKGKRRSETSKLYFQNICICYPPVRPTFSALEGILRSQ